MSMASLGCRVPAWKWRKDLHGGVVIITELIAIAIVIAVIVVVIEIIAIIVRIEIKVVIATIFLSSPQNTSSKNYGFAIRNGEGSGDYTCMQVLYYSAMEMFHNRLQFVTAQNCCARGLQWGVLEFSLRTIGVDFKPLPREP